MAITSTRQGTPAIAVAPMPPPGAATVNSQNSAATVQSSPNVSSTSTTAASVTTTNSTAIIPTGNFSFVRPIEPVTVRDSGMKQYYKDDAVSIADTHLANNGYQRVSANGISSLRPEMISVANFSPVFIYTNEGGKIGMNLTAHGTMIDIVNKATQLRQDNLSVNVNNMSLTLNNAASIFGQMKADFDTKFGLVNGYVKYANEIHTTLDQIKNLLDFYDELKSYIIKYNLGQFSLQGAIDPNRTSLTIDTRTFINRYMKFNPADVEKFTNTKLYLQMVCDLKAMLESYSLELFSDTDTDRGQFTDPFSIDVTYGSSVKDSRFTLDKWIPTDGTVLGATRQVHFDNFYKMMPIQPEDRIKLLTTILSKEYRISKGLGNSNVASILQTEFGAGNIGNPFDNICGSPGQSIFDDIRGDKSLASVAKLKSTSDATVDVFPFENKYIDKDVFASTIGVGYGGPIKVGDKTYIPGSNYLVDTIVDFSNQQVNVNGVLNDIIFSINPITAYANSTNRKLQAANDIIRSLLDVNNGGVTQLNPVTMFRKILQRTFMSTQGLIYEKSVSPDQAAICAIFRYAYSDPTLKAMLFQYILLCGIVIAKQKGDKKVFEHLSQELKTTAELPYLPKIAGATNVAFDGDVSFSVIIEKSAQLIEQYIMNALYRNAGGTSEISGPAIVPGGFSAAYSFSTDKGKILGPSGVQTIGLDNVTSVILQNGDISSILKSVVYPTDSNIPYTNLISEFIYTADLFYDLAMENNTANFIVAGTANSVPQTRFNLVTTSGQMLMLYEIFLSVSQQYVKADFAIETTFGSNAFMVYVNNEIQKIINDMYGNYVASNKEVDSFSLLKLDPRITSTFNNPTPTSDLTATQSNYLKPSFNFLFNATTGKWSPNAEITLTQTVTGQKVLVVPKTSNQTQTQISTDSLDQLVKLYGSYNNVGAYQQTEKSLVNDAKAIEGILSMFTVIQTNMKGIVNAVGATFNVFNPTGVAPAQGTNTKPLNTATINFFSQFTGEYSFFKDRSQVQIATRYLDRFKYQLENAPQIENTNIDDALRPIFAGFVPTKKELQLMFKFLSQDKFLTRNLAADRTKIISVGVPVGFSKTITERMKRDGQSNNFHGRTNTDIVNINVYKRDYRFDEIVFKPKTYQFDLSLYQDDQQFNPFANLDDVTYDSCKEFNLLYDYGTLVNNQAKSYSYRSIAQNNERYRLISDDARKQIFTNHLESYLLERYLNYTTGLNINEGTFYAVKAGSALSVINNITNIPVAVQGQFREMVYRYLELTMGVTGLSGRTFDAVIKDPNVPKDAKDFLNLISFSYVFNPDYLFNKVMIPKMFERVLHIPITTENVDPFYIDFDASKKTQTGVLSLQSLALNNKIVKSTNGESYLKPADSKEAIFVDYFVTIEGSDIIL